MTESTQSSRAGMLSVMVNNCFGGFGLSQEAIAEYYRRTRELATSSICRHDPVMVQIVREMGHRANDRHARVELEDIPAEYADFYIIQEYDGRETLVIEYDRYKVAMAKMILKNQNLSHKERLARISAVLYSTEGDADQDRANVRSVVYP